MTPSGQLTWTVALIVPVTPPGTVVVPLVEAPWATGEVYPTIVYGVSSPSMPTLVETIVIGRSVPLLLFLMFHVITWAPSTQCVSAVIVALCAEAGRASPMMTAAIIPVTSAT